MGVFDYLSDLYESWAITTVEAEEPQKDDEDSGEEGGEEKSEDSGEGGEEGGDEEGGDDAEEEEEEEEEEPEDIKPKLEEECLRTSQCAPLKHHYDECAERVQKQQEENDGKAEEDCVEEFFHMMHCASQCAAPKLFRQLR